MSKMEMKVIDYKDNRESAVFCGPLSSEAAIEVGHLFTEQL